MIRLAWRMVKFQPDSALVQWFKQRTENAKGSRKPMIVALARKLIIALWRYANDGVIPEGFRLLAMVLWKREILVLTNRW
jgi:transposase